MSATDWAYLAARTSAELQAGGHRTYFVPILAAIAATANDVGDMAEDVQNYYSLIGGLYNLALAVSGGTLAVGSDQLDVPLNVGLGGLAFLGQQQALIRRPVTRDAAYQIVPADFWTDMLLTTSGTRTYTLPLWSDMPDFVPPLSGKNRSGNNLTIARRGSDTMDAAATSVTVPTGSSYDIYKSDTAGLWEVRVYA